MPLPGDQHRDNRATTNPFLEQRPVISEFTAQEIAILQSRLDKQLGPEYISTRPGNGGGKLHYLAADKVINLANEVFGFNGWSSAIQNVQIDFVDEDSQHGKISLGLSTIVRVTLRDGTYHEDTGYGHIENCRGKAAAFEKAKKEAATDALKRALRNFGNVLGNCLYDKDYLQRVTKIKVAPSKWDAANLHRHPDFAPIKQDSIADMEAQINKEVAARRQSSVQSGVSFASGEFEDDFGGNPFDETDFTNPDVVRLEDGNNGVEAPTKSATNGDHSGVRPRSGLSRQQSMPQNRPANVHPPPPVQRPNPPQQLQAPQKPLNNAPQASRAARPQANIQLQQTTSAQIHPNGAGSRSNTSSGNSAALPPNQICLQQPAQPQYEQADQYDERSPLLPSIPPPGNPEGFVTGHAADLLNQAPEARTAISNIRPFNPHTESPSIRRTQGINPGKSAPVTRQALNGPVMNGNVGPAGQMQTASGIRDGTNASMNPVRANFVNPGADPNRRIGMPQPATMNPMQGRGAYRPPTGAPKRPPLSDMSNYQQMDGAADVKRARLEPSAEMEGETSIAVPGAS